ncbi:hypothetical protein D0Z08_13845 [Nocardioides immobilis]|uniref:Uncharacterized protein n=1 Tax=Nocardioides immobilis TaxID=2049295 RepID=A0A417Y185_9ACTN|nr:hypothetical protein [Nocardioides immobilis]RHW26419.1 hypothetical protein D0Z08_13845 [Nocardioides immobilis]
MDSETEAIVLSRINHADGDGLIRAADGMDTAYKQFWNARGRVAGVRVDLVNQWDSASGRTMLDYLETVDGALAQVGGQLSIMPEKLRAHGRLINTTRASLRDLIVQGYQDPLSVSGSDIDVLLQGFLDSERALTSDLWTYGALAPGGIPLPEPPPRPPGNWKTFLFGDGYPAGWYWLGADGKSPDPDDYGFGEDFDPGAFDPEHPRYGYDEWGNLVPAYQAAMPVPMHIQEASIGGGLLKLLGKAAKGAGVTSSGARAIAQNADDLAALVRGSYGWRPSHIDRHIREWYRLADDAPVQPWMRDEYLDLVVQAGIKQGKVFQWSLRGESGAQSTYSVLRYTNGRWLVSQYYANGARAGEFATAFEPTARQLARMLQQAAIR